MTSKYNLKENIGAIIIFFGLFIFYLIKQEYLISIFMLLNIIILFTHIAEHQKNRIVMPLFITAFIVNILIVVYCIIAKNYLITIVCFCMLLLDVKRLIKLKN